MAYDITRVRKEFNEICSKCGVQVQSPVELNGRLTRTLGRVMLIKKGTVVTPTKVEFSKQLLATATDESIWDVIAHEAAHYVATIRTKENHNHDAYFKKVCAEIGTTNDGTTTDVQRTVAADKIYKYQVECPDCNSILGYYHRKTRTLQNLSSCSCGKCHSRNLKLVQNY